MFFGGLFHSLIKPYEALRTWGMTEEVAKSQEAQLVYYGHTTRTSTLGLLIFAFYMQGNLSAVDTMMAIMGGYCGLADVLVLWRFGDRGVVPVRLLGGLGIAAWGAAGMTARGSK